MVAGGLKAIDRIRLKLSGILSMFDIIINDAPKTYIKAINGAK